MPTRRQGNPTGFWNNYTTTTTNELSGVARTGWGYDNFCIWLDVSGASTITLLVANEEPASTEGLRPDEPQYVTDTSVFFPAWYLDIELKWSFTGAAQRAIIIPDFTPLYARLKCNASSVTLKCGWQASGD